MFQLENILTYVSANIQIIGIFIAIIGGLVATKLLNMKIEKDALKEKLIKINKEINFYNNKKIMDEEQLYEINRIDYINYIYEKVRQKDFRIEDYDTCNLTIEQRRKIVDEINEIFNNAIDIFKTEHSMDDIPNIIKQNHIAEGTIEYLLYEYVGKKTRKRKTNSLGMLDYTDIDFSNPQIAPLSDTLLERELINRIDKSDEFIEWKLIEKEDIESKLCALNNINVKNDIILFISITFFAIIFPQIILSIYPIFIKFKWLKYIFAIYNIVVFIISMFLMLLYIFKLFLDIKKEKYEKFNMNTNNNGFVKMWDNWSKRRSSVPVYDLWLDEYKEILESNKDNEILDLGCGIGADTLYLIERGYNVLSCDFSNEALKSIQDNIPNSKTLYLDMMKKFPIKDNTYSLIIADLSLHYFDNETTIHIMREIKRILNNNGILLSRVASVNDFNFGAGVGEELERNYYFEGDYTKRFFDFEDINKYFGIIGSVEAEETQMTRNEDEYLKPKILYKVKVEKGK